MGVFGNVTDKSVCIIEKKKINRQQTEALKQFVSSECIDPWNLEERKSDYILSCTNDGGELLDFLIQIEVNPENVIWEETNDKED